MSDRTLREAERAWREIPEDPERLSAFLHELIRLGEDPLRGLAAAAPAAPWSGFLKASVPIYSPRSRRFGRRLFALIHNGTFFHTGIDVFGPDAIDAWGKTSRAGLPEVRPRVKARGPEGQFSIHSLGGGDLLESEWFAQREDLFAAVDATLAALPLLAELTPPTAPSRSWQSLPYRVVEGQAVLGVSLPVLVREDEGFRLEPWLSYADGRSQLGPLGPLREVEDLAQALEEGREVTTSADDGAWIRLPGLGRARLRTPGDWSCWYIDAAERIKEVRDELAQLEGAAGAHEACRQALADYRAAEDGPAAKLAAARDALERAYLAVPAHARCYLGDMDSKDGEYRWILYPEQFED